MERRVELIGEWKDGESIVALAESYGVSRKTIYKWIDRHAAEGTAGLQDRSRAPRSSPQQLSEETIARVIAARQRWGWGPRKLVVKLAQAAGEEKGPAASTIAECCCAAKGCSSAPAAGCRRRCTGRPSPRSARPTKPGAPISKDGSVPCRRHALRSVNDHRRAQPLSAVLPDRGENRHRACGGAV